MQNVELRKGGFAALRRKLSMPDAAFCILLRKFNTLDPVNEPEPEPGSSASCQGPLVNGGRQPPVAPAFCVL